MAGFDIFDDAQGGPDMAAPGLPMGALSGNPAATFVNTSAMLGASAGDQLARGITGAIGAAMGRPMVDPAQVRQSRRDQFAALYQQELASGKTDGEAFLSAAELARKQGVLAPDEYLRARDAGIKRREVERKAITDVTDDLYKSDFYKNFIDAKNNYMAMVDLAEDAESINDFALIQRFLKTIDPDSATLQGEIDAAKISTSGLQSLKNVVGNSEAANLITGLMRFQAGAGNVLTLNRKQKEKLLAAARDVVNAKQRGAVSAWDQAKSVYIGAGGNAKLFTDATAAAVNQFKWSAESATAGRAIGSGTMPDTWLALPEMAERNKEVGERLGGAAATAAELVGLFGVNVAKGAAKGIGETVDDAVSRFFGIDSDPADAVGASNAMNPEEVSNMQERSFGTGSRILNNAADIVTGGHVGRMVGNATMAPVTRQSLEQRTQSDRYWRNETRKLIRQGMSAEQAKSVIRRRRKNEERARIVNQE